jgi:hypothetical protein
VTFAVATVSFLFIEEPIRTHRMFRGRMGVGLAAAAAALTAAAVLAATVAPTVATVRQGSSFLSQVERRALASSHAFSKHPIRFLLAGDSVALTLGIGLSSESVRRYGVQIADGGLPGCDLDNVEVRVSGTVEPATPGCTHWRLSFKSAVDRIHPDVVGVLLGKWEVTDHLWHGKWVHVGQPAWDRHLVAELEQVADIFSSKGAKVIFFTCPYIDPPVEAANGTPYPENDPSRMKAWNRVLVEAAAKRKDTVTVIRLNRLLDPHGRYQAVVDGYTVRWSDGIHITAAGGELAQRWIMPVVVQLGLESRARTVHR